MNVYDLWRSNKFYQYLYPKKEKEFTLDQAVFWACGRSGLHLGDFPETKNGFKSAWDGMNNTPISIQIDDFEEYRSRFLLQLCPGDWITMD